MSLFLNLLSAKVFRLSQPSENFDALLIRLCSLNKKSYSLKTLYLFCEFKKKQNTFRIYWICSIFLFFRPIVKKNLWKTCLFYQTKSRFYLELDSKIQASKDIVKEKEHRRICCSRRNYHQSRLWIHLVVGCYWA